MEAENCLRAPLLRSSDEEKCTDGYWRRAVNSRQIISNSFALYFKRVVYFEFFFKKHKLSNIFFEEAEESQWKGEGG
jgi:hypothetical protein